MGAESADDPPKRNHGPRTVALARPGARLGDWVLEGQLGRGGMGTVYAARNVLTPRLRAAVKVIPAEEGDAGYARFLKELEAMATLRHPAIVRVLGGGVSVELGAAFLAMDLVEGKSLSDCLITGPLPSSQALGMARQLASALATAHRSGIYHRDLKPSNVMMTPDGPVLVDFGIARVGEGPGPTSEGVVPGTVGYLAPEVFEAAAFDPARAEIYALGLLLYEASAGRPAWDCKTGTTGEIGRIVAQKLAGEPVELGDPHPPALRRLVRQLTARQPSERPASMDAVIAAIDSVIAEPAGDPSSLGRPPPQTVAKLPRSGANELPPRPNAGPGAWPILQAVVEAPAPAEAPTRVETRTVLVGGGFLLFAGVGGAATVLALVLVGVAIWAQWRAVERETRADALGKQAENELQSFKTDPARNADRGLLASAALSARRSLELNETPHVRGIAALADVWGDRWHYAGQVWNENDWRKREQALAEDLGEDSPAGAKLAEGILRANACRLAPETDPLRAQQCEAAAKALELVATADLPDWLKFERQWTVAMLHNQRAARARAAGLPSEEELRLALGACDAGFPLLGSAPVNDVELYDECVVAAGAAQDWPAYFTWSRRLVTRTTQDGKALPKSKLKLIFRAAGDGCDTIPAPDGAGGHRLRTVRHPDAIRCAVAGALALGCAQDAEAALYWGNASTLEPLLNAYTAAPFKCQLR